MNHPLLSVIILNFNTRNYLRQCLQSVAESKGFDKGEMEIIVVDNGSTDGSVEVAAKFQVSLIENNKNLGFAGGNNVGIRQAKGKYILLLNSDTTVYSDTLSKITKFAEGESKAGAVTCGIELPGGKIDPACHRGFPTPWNALTYIAGLEKLFPRTKIFGGYHQGWKNYSLPHQVDVISGSFFLIPKKVIEKVGLLDESFFMYGEDIDWCYRIKRAGFEIWYNPQVKILHYKKQSGRARRQRSGVRGQASEVRRQAEYHFVYTMEQFYRKHYMKKYPKWVNWLVLAGINSLKLLNGVRHSERSRGIQAARGGRFKSLSLDPSTTPSTRSARSGSARDDEVMKVVIDARLSGLKNAGIGRYVQMLSEHICNFQFSCPQSLRDKRCRRAIFNFQTKTINPRIKHYSFAEQLEIPFILAKENPDLVHFPHFNVPLLYNKAFIVTVHDLLWHERVGFSATTLPRWLYLIKYVGYRVVLRHAILKAKAVVVPSKWVEKKILERFPQIKSKIHVIYEGVADIFRGVSLSKQGNSSFEPYLIYTGSLYPHKNVAAILNVLKHFDDLKLVVACARSIFWEKFRLEVRKRNLEDRVILAGFVPDEELAVLYGKAAAFVFPSLSEGFGLPGLEAMAAGCPVISSTAGALPEIYGQAATYFNPLSKKDLVKKIKRIREDKVYRRKMIKLGRERVKMFSWERCAKETLGVYQLVLK